MKVRLSRNAQAELTAVLEYIHERSPSGASHVLAEFDRAFEIISKQPRSGQATDDPQVRMKLAGKYPCKLFYTISADIIEIVHIRHAARRPWGTEGG